MLSSATRIAFLIAMGELEPCAMMQMPSTPKSRLPPYSSALIFLRMALNAPCASTAPAIRSGFFCQFVFEPTDDRMRQRLGALEHDVADESLAQHDLHRVLEQVVAFDVAAESSSRWP